MPILEQKQTCHISIKQSSGKGHFTLLAHWCTLNPSQRIAWQMGNFFFFCIPPKLPNKTKPTATQTNTQANKQNANNNKENRRTAVLFREHHHWCSCIRRVNSFIFISPLKCRTHRHQELKCRYHYFSRRSSSGQPGAQLLPHRTSPPPFIIHQDTGTKISPISSNPPPAPPLPPSVLLLLLPASPGSRVGL